MSNNELTIRLDPEQIQELKDYVDTQIAAALEPTTPQPQPEPLTVKELVGIMHEEGWHYLTATKFAYLMYNHPRIGPLLRGEGQAKRVELAYAPPPRSAPKLYGQAESEAWQEGRELGWAAARAQVAQQQEEG